MAVFLSPLFNPDSPQVDTAGVPRAFAKLFTYLANTTTKVTVFKNSAGTSEHTNPIILSSNGLAPDTIFLTGGSAYKFVLAPPGDTDPPSSPILTLNNITGIGDASAALFTEWSSSGLTPTFVSATSFTIAGDQTSNFHIGRRLKTTNSGGTIYSTITRSVFTTLTTVTVENDSGVLDSGLSVVSFGIISATNISSPFLSNEQNCGRLNFVSATSIRLDPQDGRTIWVNTGGLWKLRNIPAAGISAANTSIFIDGVGGSNLAANSTYYVYLFDNAGTLTADFSFTVYATDATSGLKIKTGVASRLLIGMARTNASSQFQLVASYYQSRDIIESASFTTNRTTTSTAPVEINSEIRTPFVNWAGEPVRAFYTGLGQNDTANGGHGQRIGMDSTPTYIAQTHIQISAVNGAVNLALTGVNNPAEGFHYMSIWGYVILASTATWVATSTGSGTLFVIRKG